MVAPNFDLTSEQQMRMRAMDHAMRAAEMNRSNSMSLSNMGVRNPDISPAQIVKDAQVFFDWLMAAKAAG